MSLTLISKASLPVTARGKAGSLSVSVRENGQIGFSNQAAETLKGFTSCKIEWDGDDRTMIFTPINSNKLPKGVKAEELFTVGLSEKTGSRYISAAGLFKLEAIAYDYKAAGTHTFPAEVNEKGQLSFTLPEKMDAKPKVTRTSSKKAAGAAAGAGTAATKPAAEPELQEA